MKLSKIWFTVCFLFTILVACSGDGDSIPEVIVEARVPEDTILIPIIENETTVSYEVQAAGVSPHRGFYGCVDLEGNMVLPPQFTDAGTHSEGLIAVQIPIDYSIDGIKTEFPGTLRWGYVNALGEWVVEPRFLSAEEFHDGIAKVSWVEHTAGSDSQKIHEISHFGFIDREGNVRFSWSLDYPEDVSPSPLDGTMRSFFNGEHLFENKNRPQSTRRKSFEETRNRYSTSSEGLIRFRDPDSDLYGFVDTSGETVIPPTYPIALSFHDGLAVAMDPNTQVYGYIDTSGRFVIGGVTNETDGIKSEEYLYISSFSDGFAVVGIGKYEGSRPSNLEQSRNWTVEWHYIDKSGNSTYRWGVTKYLDIYGQFGNTWPLGKIENGVGVSAHEYEGSGRLSASSYHQITKSKEPRIIDPYGKVILDLDKSEWNASGVRSFSEGFFPVYHSETKQPAFINPNGEIILRLNGLKKDNKNFKNGAVSFESTEKGVRSVYINTRGEEIFRETVE